MIFRKRNQEIMKITLRNKIILHKESIQFMGMTIDSRLNWKEHIDRVRLKTKTLVVAGKKWRGDLKKLTMVDNCTEQLP